MPIPNFQVFMRPLLAFGADGSEHNIQAAIAALGDQFKLTDEDRAVLVPSGKQTLLANRVHWARTYLDKAGALERTRRSHFRLTDRGRELLKSLPDSFDVKALKQFPEFMAFHAPGPTTDNAAPSNPPATLSQFGGPRVRAGDSPRPAEAMAPDGSRQSKSPDPEHVTPLRRGFVPVQDHRGSRPFPGP